MTDTSTEADVPTTLGGTDVERIEDWLIGRIRFYDQVDAALLTTQTPLTDLGLDSVYVMTLCGDIEDEYGFEIDPEYFESFTTLGDLANGLAAALPA